jgi:hypothetical protein
MQSHLKSQTDIKDVSKCKSLDEGSSPTLMFKIETHQKLIRSDINRKSINIYYQPPGLPAGRNKAAICDHKLSHLLI